MKRNNHNDNGNITFTENFIEIPIRSCHDIMTITHTNTIIRSPDRLYFPFKSFKPVSSRSLDHGVRHILHFSDIHLDSKHTITGAHLQLMGSHPRIKSLNYDQLVTISNITLSPYRREHKHSFYYNQPSMYLKRDKNGVIPKVDWTTEDENWEAGEVWVSPDIKEIVLHQLKSQSGRVSLMMEGFSQMIQKNSAASSNSAPNELLPEHLEERGVYGIHEQLSTCVSPTLVLKIIA